ncbi:MAG TPA: hypothetical protein VFA50_00175 [Stellaceae bacterium]|nr:hypothetical protein [Stellaceae bacterium]
MSIVLLFTLTYVGLALTVMPGADAAAALREKAQISESDKALCESFGMKLGTSQHRDCVTQLMKIRQDTSDRIYRAAQSLL